MAVACQDFLAIEIAPVTWPTHADNELVIDDVAEGPVLTDTDPVAVAAGEFHGFGWVGVVAEKLDGALNAPGHLLVESS